MERVEGPLVLLKKCKDEKLRLKVKLLLIGRNLRSLLTPKIVVRMCFKMSNEPTVSFSLKISFELPRACMSI